MATRYRRRFVHAQLAWMGAAIVVLSLLDSLTYDVFFIVSFVGFLVIAGLTAPLYVTPRWRTRLTWIIAAGLLGFGYIVGRRILTILGAL